MMMVTIPLTSNNWFHRWTLVGVTSFGVDCARPDFPGVLKPQIHFQTACHLFHGDDDVSGVYTRVDQYLDWIRSNV